MSKYADLDEAIVRAVRAGHDEFYRLWPAVADCTRQVLARHGRTRWVEVDRVVDRRLQAIRKRGELRFENGRWVVVTPAAGTEAAGGDTSAPGGAKAGWQKHPSTRVWHFMPVAGGVSLCGRRSRTSNPIRSRPGPCVCSICNARIVGKA